MKVQLQDKQMSHPRSDNEHRKVSESPQKALPTPAGKKGEVSRPPYGYQEGGPVKNIHFLIVRNVGDSLKTTPEDEHNPQSQKSNPEWHCGCRAAWITHCGSGVSLNKTTI
jgi:hypothetical protein